MFTYVRVIALAVLTIARAVVAADATGYVHDAAAVVAIFCGRFDFSLPGTTVNTIQGRTC